MYWMEGAARRSFEPRRTENETPGWLPRLGEFVAPRGAPPVVFALPMTDRSRVRFCPLCATPLVPRDDLGKSRPTCPACGFIHYRNPAPAAGVIVHREGEVLLVKRKYAPRVGTWCLPAGFMEYGETPRQCATRELFEETGLRARLGELFGVYAGLDDPRVRAILVLYVAAGVRGTLTPGDDALEAEYFPLTRPPRNIAFAAHAQALREFAALLKRQAQEAALLKRQALGAAPAIARARMPRRSISRRSAATPPRPTRAARPRSRRA